MKLHSLLMFIPLLFLSACSGVPGQPELSKDEVINGNLHLVTNARVGRAYLDPDADFSRYTKILLSPLDFSQTQIVQPKTTATSAVARRPWELTDADRQRLQDAYRQSFVQELEETGDYSVVDKPGPGVLLISASLDELAPAAAKDDNRSRAAGRTRVYTPNAGSMTITFGFADSETKQLLAVIKDSRNGTPVWNINNSVTNLSEARNMFRRWARMLRARLDIAHGY